MIFHKDYPKDHHINNLQNKMIFHKDYHKDHHIDYHKKVMKILLDNKDYHKKVMNNLLDKRKEINNL